jgi:hypothetical protein
MYYTTLEKAQEEQVRWLKKYKEQREIFKVPRATTWKFWLGTKESWEHECKLIQKRLEKYKLKKSGTNK